jgi:orotidine 5'-phosphate decarboxylase subfamily 1
LYTLTSDFQSKLKWEDERKIPYSSCTLLVFNKPFSILAGNTVKLQYQSGIYKIASWAHMVNAHTLPGPGIVQGLRKVSQDIAQPRGLLLLAEMSSQGGLFTSEYTSKTVAMAEDYKDFVIGFIAQRKLPSATEFLILSPGVGLDEPGDGLGQQYRTPHQVICEDGSDIIIVGRGIYKPGRDPVIEAQRYQKAGWDSYQQSLNA